MKTTVIGDIKDEAENPKTKETQRSKTCVSHESYYKALGEELEAEEEEKMTSEWGNVGCHLCACAAYVHVCCPMHTVKVKFVWPTHTQIPS